MRVSNVLLFLCNKVNRIVILCSNGSTHDTCISRPTMFQTARSIILNGTCIYTVWWLSMFGFTLYTFVHVCKCEHTFSCWQVVGLYCCIISGRWYLHWHKRENTLIILLRDAHLLSKWWHSQNRPASNEHTLTWEVWSSSTFCFILLMSKTFPWYNLFTSASSATGGWVGLSQYVQYLAC